jgi:hypothetical protein
MFIRTKFVTNSSSTSFIFYGMNFGSKEFETLVALLKRREKIQVGEPWQEFDAVYSYMSSLRPDISVHLEWESREFQIYAKDSYCSLDECGVDEMPMDKLVSLYGKEGDWHGKLVEFASKLELAESPRWLIAIYVDR